MEIFDEFGNSRLLHQARTAFLCSRQVPVEHHEVILQWARCLPMGTCVVGGFQSPLERQVANILLQRGVPLIWVALTHAEVKAKIDALRRHVDEQRLLILVMYGPDCPLSSSQQSFMRNMAVIRHADEIVVGHLQPDGTLSRQLSGCDHFSTLVGSQHHRHVDYLRLHNGFLHLSTISDVASTVLHLSQHRRADNYERLDVLQLSPDEAVRLRDMLDRGIEVNGWADSIHEEIRQTYPNAYRHWSPDEELILRDLSQQGLSDTDIAALLDRQPGAVASRRQLIIDRESQHEEC